MEHTIIIQIALAALVGAMQQIIQHYFPWQMIFGKELPRVMAYIIGTLAFMVPLTVLFVIWDQVGCYPRLAHLAAVWACVAASGLAVIVVRGIDWILDRVRRSYEHEEMDDAKAGKEQ